MRKDIADRWVQALRSGRYGQGSGYLQASGFWCCLGVLCDVLKDELPSRPDWSPTNEDPEVDVMTFLGQTKVLPEEVISLAQMFSGVGDFRTEGEACLATINDRGKSFTEIADIIASDWENL